MALLPVSLVTLNGFFMKELICSLLRLRDPFDSWHEYSQMALVSYASVERSR